jgi:hypothetical protein
VVEDAQQTTVDGIKRNILFIQSNMAPSSSSTNNNNNDNK